MSGQPKTTVLASALAKVERLCDPMTLAPYPASDPLDSGLTRGEARALFSEILRLREVAPLRLADPLAYVSRNVFDGTRQLTPEHAERLREQARQDGRRTEEEEDASS